MYLKNYLLTDRPLVDSLSEIILYLAKYLDEREIYIQTQSIHSINSQVIVPSIHQTDWRFKSCDRVNPCQGRFEERDMSDSINDMVTCTKCNNRRRRFDK